jgi:hypothetical protein
VIKVESVNEEIKKWLESGNFVTEQDAGKQAVIIAIPKLVEGKFGQKLHVDIELTDSYGKHETKMMGVGKLMARDMAKKLGDPTKWLGARGKISLIKTFNPEKKVLYDKPIFEVL